MAQTGLPAARIKARIIACTAIDFMFPISPHLRELHQPAR
jgi:hypothetical protein